MFLPFVQLCVKTIAHRFINTTVRSPLTFTITVLHKNCCCVTWHNNHINFFFWETVNCKLLNFCLILKDMTIRNCPSAADNLFQNYNVFFCSPIPSAWYASVKWLNKQASKQKHSCGNGQDQELDWKWVKKKPMSEEKLWTFGNLENYCSKPLWKKKESLASCNQNKKKWVVTHNKWCHICPFFEFNLYLYVIVAWGAVTPYESTSLELIMLCLAHQFRRVTWRRGCVLQLWFVQYSTIDLLQLLKSLFLCSIISIRMAYCITSCVH